MRNYQCSKCGTLVNGTSYPRSFGCPNGGTHQWTDLGECGNTSYQCSKCGTLVNGTSYPRSFGCPNGGTHQWNKL